MDWHALSETGNVLSIISILVSALGVLVSILYARSAKRVARTALQAAAAARREILARVAAEEFSKFFEQIEGLSRATKACDFTASAKLAESLSMALATAQTAWIELPELQHEEVAVAARDVRRVLALLRDQRLSDNEKVGKVIQILDFVGRSIGRVRGRLRFRS